MCLVGASPAPTPRRWEQMCDEVWCVTAPHALTLERLRARNSLSEEEAERRIASQMGTDSRAARCDVVLSSAWGEEMVHEQAGRAYAGATARAKLELPAPPPEEATPAACASLMARWSAACGGAHVTPSLQRKWWRKLRDLHCDPVRHPPHLQRTSGEKSP